MSYNIQSYEYRYFKKQSDIQHANNRNPTTATSDTMSDEEYSQFTGFHHENSQYTNYEHKRRGYRRHTPGYEKRFTIDNNQTFITINKDRTFNVSGKITSADRLLVEENISMLPTGLTLTLTEVFGKIT